MRNVVATLALVGLVTVPLGAQGRGGSGDRVQGIPPGHLPPPGECRVWYNGRPPGHQPPPTSCQEAEQVAARDPDARVVYGGRRDARDDGWQDRDDRDRDNRDRDRDRGCAIPREGPYPYPERYPYPRRHPYPDSYPNGRGGYGYGSVAFDNGFKDGYDKGREDARDQDAYDPARHSRYRSGDHGYDRRYGSKEEYKNVYREGFRAGYEDGYREATGSSSDRYGTRSRRFPWPFRSPDVRPMSADQCAVVARAVLRRGTL
jgi:hypothetical protein